MKILLLLFTPWAIIYTLEQPATTKEMDASRFCILVESSDKVYASWDTRFWLYFPNHPIVGGDSYEFSCDVMAEKKASASSYTNAEPGAYLHWSGVGTIDFDTKWTTFKSSGLFMDESGGGFSIAFYLNDFARANKYYFDNISLKINGMEVIENGDCENPFNTASFRSQEKGGNIVPSRIVNYSIIGGDYTGITNMVNTTNDIEVYNLNGQRQPALSHGGNVIRMEDGTTRKVVVK